MSEYLVSARKYRPMSFATVVGQKALTETLQNAILQKRLAHAYLFCGPRGTGKTTCARIFAKTINCEHPVNGLDACNECASCRSFNEQRSFNIHELDAASNNSVDNIRSLIEEVRIPPQMGKYSVFIIDEVHMLSQGAFNALLKTLEEPPSYAIFILATTEKHKVLPTILSRCQVYDFARMTVADTIAHLQSIAQQEGVEADEAALNVVAQKADGGMRDALSIFDQMVSFCGNKISYEQAIEVLNVLNADYYFHMVDCAQRNDVTGAMLLFNEVLTKGFDAGNFVAGLEQHLRDVLMAKDPQTIQLLETSDSMRKRYAEQGQSVPPQWLFRALDILNTCEMNYRTAKNKRLTIEIALMKWVAPQAPVAAAPAAAPIAAQAQPRPATAQAATKPAAAPTAQAFVAQPNPKFVPQAAQAQKMGSLPKMPTIGGLPTMPTMPSVGTATAPKEATAQVEQKENPTRTTPFRADQLNDAWVGLKKHFEKEPRLNSLITDYRPTLQADGVHAVVMMPNKLQMETLQKRMGDILRWLHDALQNDTLQITLELSHYEREQVAYTADERYKVMVKSNPVLAQLKTELEMVLE